MITIDGPAASGKTSVSRELARRLQMKWVSTGAFYRGLAYAAQRLNLNLRDEDAMAQLAASDEWSVEMDADTTRVYFHGQDVTEELNAESVGGAASIVSQLPKVRQTLLPLQRACFDKSAGLIAEGRDCGSVVFPQAPVKFYLTARSEDRAQRRAKDEGKSVDSIHKAQANRDQQDQSRLVAPLQIPKESHVVDTSDMSFDQVVDHLEKIVRERLRP
ncbi:MAG TPA: (d)CMP kinase [Bdellovibrionales bacterium]|nr:(d)CMP kinase [Bdellovibrionales bacterium]